ncbi:hypothetical protein JHK82_046175 [Glycine max]|nr:hypothetical protein JHK82_046175 [Glycine max]
MAASTLLPLSGKLDAYNTTSLPKPTTPPFSPLSHSMLKPIPTANAYHSYGYNYYPKLQSCVPFAPVTVPRILLRNTSFKHQIFSAIKELTLTLSSLHVTFPSENECHKLTEKGFLPRIGMQYHWKNRNYKNLDDFLMDMKQSKRKNIRQECKKVTNIDMCRFFQQISAQNLIMKRLRGYLIKARHWDSFYTFYRNTTDNKWGTPHLTREFFHELGAKMGDNVLLVVAEEGDELVAGALNLIGGDTLFGRLWGCQPRSYYQAIEAAIELNLKTVEAGAQDSERSTTVSWSEIENHGCSLESPYLRCLIERSRCTKARGEHVGVDYVPIECDHWHTFQHLFCQTCSALLSPTLMHNMELPASHPPSPSRRRVHYYHLHLLFRYATHLSSPSRSYPSFH